MSEKILEIERNAEEVILRFRQPVLQLLPVEAKAHFKAARKETLLAMRSLLDAAIGRLERSEEARGKKRAKVEVKD